MMDPKGRTVLMHNQRTRGQRSKPLTDRRAELAARHVHLAKWIAGSVGGPLSHEEKVSTAYLALCHAARDYRVGFVSADGRKHKAKFSTYAARCCLRAVLRDNRSRARKMFKERITPFKVETNSGKGMYGGGGCSYDTSPPCRDSPPEHSAYLDGVKEELEFALSSMTKRERLAWELYAECGSWVLVSEKMGITKQRAHQLGQAGSRRAKRAFERQGVLVEG